MADSYLAHHGVLGMKWGVRRYQNKKGLPNRLKARSTDKRKKQLTDKQKKIIKAAVITGAAVVGGYAAYKLGAFDAAKVAVGKARIKMLEKKFNVMETKLSKDLFDHKISKETYNKLRDELFDDYYKKKNIQRDRLNSKLMKQLLAGKIDRDTYTKRHVRAKLHGW